MEWRVSVLVVGLCSAFGAQPHSRSAWRPGPGRAATADAKSAGVDSI